MMAIYMTGDRSILSPEWWGKLYNILKYNLFESTGDILRL